MKSHWIAAAILTSTLALGCGTNAAETATNEEAAPAAEAPAAPASSAGAVRAHSPAPKAAPKRKASPVAPVQPRFREVAAPAGTELSLELTTALSTETAQAEDPVTARLRRPVVVGGVTVFPAGAAFHGNVTEVERAGRVRGRAHIAFRFTEVAIDEQRDPVRTNSVSFEGEATKSEDATKIGVGAGIGAVIGGIVGGGSGAAKGAAIGGAAGTGAVLATRGKDVVLPAGSDLNATLASPFEIQVEAQ